MSELSTKAMKFAERMQGTEFENTAIRELLIECSEQLDQKDALISELVGALENAQRFIENGIEFGYIRMPDDDLNDSAKKTPGVMKAALTKAKEAGHVRKD